MRMIKHGWAWSRLLQGGTIVIAFDRARLTTEITAKNTPDE